MATKATRYGYNGGYNAQYNGSNADYAERETAKNVKSAKRALKVIVLSLAAFGIMATSSGCNGGDVVKAVNDSVKQSVGIQNNAVDVLQGTVSHK